MRAKYILITMIVIFALVSLFIYIDPSVTSFAVQDRFLISNVKVSAASFDQEIKVEQFDDHSIKLDNSLYYFTLDVNRKQEINYILVEFMVDSSQFSEDIGLYYYDQEWKELEKEFVKKDGRYNYYKAKADDFGLFGVARKKLEDKVAAPIVSKSDLLMFGLIPVILCVLLFILLSYSFVLVLQKFSYRFYLVLKRIFVEIIKFVLSLSIVILILDLISADKVGNVSNINLIYYAVIPVLVLSLLSDAILNLILWIHRVIEYNRIYKFFRNTFWLFGFVFLVVVGLLYKFIPKVDGVLSDSDVLIFGLIPLVVISFLFLFLFYSIYALIRRVLVHE